MSDGSFHPCARTEHSELLNKLLYGNYSKYRQLSSVQKNPDGGACLWDTDFKFISFEGDITPEVREFVESNLNNFSKEQLKLIKTKFMSNSVRKAMSSEKLAKKSKDYYNFLN